MTHVIFTAVQGTELLHTGCDRVGSHQFGFRVDLFVWLSWVCSTQAFSLAVASGGSSLAAMCKLLIAVAPLVWSTGSRRAGFGIAAHGLKSRGAWA